MQELIGAPGTVSNSLGKLPLAQAKTSPKNRVKNVLDISVEDGEKLSEGMELVEVYFRYFYMDLRGSEYSEEGAAVFFEEIRKDFDLGSKSDMFLVHKLIEIIYIICKIDLHRGNEGVKNELLRDDCLQLRILVALSRAIKDRQISFAR